MGRHQSGRTRSGVGLSPVRSHRKVRLNRAPDVGTGFGPVAFVAFGLRLGHEAGGLRPPLASPAPTSLACPHAEE